jgi:DNA-binding beta-propeller fold protein YncE
MRTELLAWLIAFAAASSVHATGFTAGHLIVGGSNEILLINPVTGASQVAFSGDSLSGSILDVAFNPVTQSAFFVAGELTGLRDLFELRWSPADGFTSSTKLSGLNDTKSLAIDRQGNVLFDQEDFVDHDLWRLNLDGSSERVSQPGFATLFVPEDMELSPDGRLLFVSNIPSNNLQTINLTTGEIISTVDSSWPTGISARTDGAIFVAEGGPGDPLSDRISIISPSGAKSTYAQQPWMEFLGSGFWGDIEYDNVSSVLFANKGSRLYAIDRNLVTRQVTPGFITVNGLDIITVPEPAPMALLGIAIFTAILQRRSIYIAPNS